MLIHSAFGLEGGAPPRSRRNSKACAGSSSARHLARASFGARGTSSPQLRRQALASDAAAVPTVPLPARWPVAACCSSSSQAPSRMTPATVTRLA